MTNPRLFFLCLLLFPNLPQLSSPFFYWASTPHSIQIEQLVWKRNWNHSRLFVRTTAFVISKRYLKTEHGTRRFVTLERLCFSWFMRVKVWFACFVTMIYLSSCFRSDSLISFFLSCELVGDRSDTRFQSVWWRGQKYDGGWKETSQKSEAKGEGVKKAIISSGSTMSHRTSLSDLPAPHFAVLALLCPMTPLCLAWRASRLALSMAFCSLLSMIPSSLAWAFFSACFGMLENMEGRKGKRDEEKRKEVSGRAW